MRFVPRYTILLFILSIILLLLDFRLVILNVQQQRLRCQLIHFSTALYTTDNVDKTPYNSNNMDYSVYNKNPFYWLDFGTLLGSVRHNDIIWTEIDLDLGINTVLRNNIIINNKNNIKAKLADRGLITIEPRDEWKFRIYDTWGFNLDLDVYDLRKNTANTHNTTACNKYSVSEYCIQMITGRRDFNMYTLPPNWYLPIHYIPIPKSMECYDYFSDYYIKNENNVRNLNALPIPFLSTRVLEYWYGSHWRIPKQYEKGLEDNNPLEKFFTENVTLLFDIALCIKLLGRLIINGLKNHPIILIGYSLLINATIYTIFYYGKLIYDDYTFRNYNNLNTVNHGQKRIVKYNIFLLSTIIETAIIHIGIIFVNRYLFMYLLSWFIVITATFVYLTKQYVVPVNLPSNNTASNNSTVPVRYELLHKN